MPSKKYLIFFGAVVCLVLLTASFAVASAWRSTPQKAALASAGREARPMTASLMFFNLADMTGRADKIFRGTVVDFTPSKVAVGGGELPMVVYLLRVDQAFKGEFDSKDGVQYVELHFVGSIKDRSAGGEMKQFDVLPSPPELLVDHDYLLFTTAPSAVGLSTTVGLGQGSFEIYELDKQEWAKNEYDNAGLYDGAVPYAALATEIQTLVAAE